MDLLGTAVVDITTLVATCHALVRSPEPGVSPLPPRLRRRLRREIKRATVAYIDTLARTQRGLADGPLLDACRVAAERQMAHAVQHQELLREVMRSEPGSLAGLAAARQDLWRVAHMVMHLRAGVAALLDSGAGVDAKSVRSQARPLRRQLRKALIAYARATLRTPQTQGTRLASARAEALAEIGSSGAAAAHRLADLEAGCAPARDAGHSALRLGVSKPLADLALDWRRTGAAAS